jgi:hypothetical protein
MADALKEQRQHPAPPGDVIELLAPVRKKPRRRRVHVDHFRTDDAEHAELATRARAAGLSVDAFCRLQTLGATGPRSRRTQPTADTKLLARNMGELNRIGANLNQGFRALNEIALTAPAGIRRDRLADELSELRQLFEQGIAALVPILEANRAALGYDREG